MREGFMTRQWRCSVCDYLHSGQQPPDVCPKCGVGPSQFELVVKQNETTADPSGLRGFALEMWRTFELHAVAAHFPNGLLPSAALFLVLFLSEAGAAFETTAFHLVVLCVLVTPLVFGSGLRDWRTRYRGAPGRIFYKKIVLSVILLVLGTAAVSLRGAAGSWGGLGQTGRIVYLALIAGMLGSVTLLGHYGGQLVFKKTAS
jgi:rubredoxin